MEISGKQSTKSYGTQWQEINKVIWYAAAGNQRSHMVRSGKKSTKSFDTQQQAISKVIWYAAASDQQSHIVLSGFVYKTAKPREATNILEYQNIISTKKWKSSASNQQSHIVRSGKKSTKSYDTQRQEINKVI